MKPLTDEERLELCQNISYYYLVEGVYLFFCSLRYRPCARKWRYRFERAGYPVVHCETFSEAQVLVDEYLERVGKKDTRAT